MAKKLVIAIDCDDVLVPSAQLIVDTYNNTYDTTVTLNDFYNADSGWQAGGRDEAIRRVDAILRSGATDDITPDPETIDAIKQLASQHELHLVTGRQSYMEPATVKLTHTHTFQAALRRLSTQIISKQPTVRHGNAQKARCASRLALIC